MDLAGLILGAVSFVVAIVAYVDARLQGKVARREASELQNRLVAVEQNLLTSLPSAIQRLIQAPSDSDAVNNLEQVVAASFQDAARLQDFADPGALEQIRSAISKAADRNDIELLLPAKRLPHREPGGYNVLVGTKAHGLWSASRRHDGSFAATQLVDTSNDKAFGYEEAAEPSHRVVEAVSDASDDEIVYFTDAWRRKERGSQLWLLRDSNGQAWKVLDQNRSATAEAQQISLT